MFEWALMQNFYTQEVKKKTSLACELVNYVRMRGSNDKPLR